MSTVVSYPRTPLVSRPARPLTPRPGGDRVEPLGAGVATVLNSGDSMRRSRRSIQLPKEVCELIGQSHQRKGPRSDCSACTSSCCHDTGFAIRPNIALIYDRYRAGLLLRSDYQFKGGLSPNDFVEYYFRTFLIRCESIPSIPPLVVALPKMLGELGMPTQVTSLQAFYEERKHWRKNYPLLDTGCVFLSKQFPPGVNDSDTSRGCILHAPHVNTHLTTKPIDCVYHICHEPPTQLAPTKAMTDRWLLALAKHFGERMSQPD